MPIFAAFVHLVHDLNKSGAGVLFNCRSKKYILLQILTYADDVLLMARSPYGLKTLIRITFAFASKYNDISYNTSKSYILRVGGPHKKPPIFVCNIPVTECHVYLGVQIGRKSDPQHV